MKIIENTDARLVLSHRPLLMRALMMGMGAATALAGFSDSGGGATIAGVLGLGLVVLGWWAFPTTLTVFDRTAALVVQQERRLSGRRQVTRALADITGAQVEAVRSDSGGRTSRLVLHTIDGPWPLERSSGTADRRAAETAVNEWLTRPT